MGQKTLRTYTLGIHHTLVKDLVHTLVSRILVE